MSLLPARYDLKIWKGATYRKRVTVLTGAVGSDPLDLTSYSASASIKDKKGSTLVTLNDANGKLVLGGVAGTIDIVLPATETDGYTWSEATYVLYITGPTLAGDTDPILYGGVSAIAG